MKKRSFPKGLNKSIVKELSQIKGEPLWMTEFRVRSYETFVSKALPD